jgi:Protein of unknown function (DUF402)
MTEASRDDQAVTDSGGTMRRLTRPPRDVRPDLRLLDGEYRSAYDEPLRPAGGPPYAETGDVITWHYGLSVDVLRVVRDDERGLVAWLPSGSEMLASVPEGGGSLRDLPLDQRFSGPRVMRRRTWRGPGVLRIAPTGRPWSIWYFTDEADGSFEGHYVNLELMHRCPATGRRVHTRDLILDLWVENGQTWLKDADELEAAVRAGRYTEEQGALVHDLAELARAELIDPGAWPLDEGWETWRPPEEWDEPLALPRDVVETARSRPT